MPLRLKGNHHVNIPSGIEKIFMLLRGLLNQKAKDRVSIHDLTYFEYMFIALYLYLLSSA